MTNHASDSVPNTLTQASVIVTSSHAACYARDQQVLHRAADMYNGPAPLVVFTGVHKDWSVPDS